MIVHYGFEHCFGFRVQPATKPDAVFEVLHLIAPFCWAIPTQCRTEHTAKYAFAELHKVDGVCRKPVATLSKDQVGYF
jgi:hypothetical protein